MPNLCESLTYRPVVGSKKYRSFFVKSYEDISHTLQSSSILFVFHELKILNIEAINNIRARMVEEVICCNFI